MSTTWPRASRWGSTLTTTCSWPTPTPRPWWSWAPGRPLLIDASIQGMGRGAGNLNTELFLEHLNDNAGGHYQVKPLLRAIDRVVGGFYQQNPWGYSLPNYLSASHNAHPNYALFLTEKNTLTVNTRSSVRRHGPPEAGEL